MDIKLIHEFVNTATSSALGRENIVKEDLSNIVESGRELFNANAVDKYVKALVNRIGKVVFVNRKYSGSAPKVLMDGWEFGSVLEKVHVELPPAVENTTWNLESGKTYDPNVFVSPIVSVKFFNKKVTFEIDMSVAEKQVKQSFCSPSELNAFVSALYNAVEQSMTVKLDELIMRTINNMIGETFYADYADSQASSKSGVKAVNLLYLYKEETGRELDANKAIIDSDFIMFASFTIGNYIKRLKKMSSLFNISGKARFTKDDNLHAVLHSDFASAASVYLQSETFHNEFTALPEADLVPYWQGSGTSYKWSDTSKIDVKTTEGHNVTLTGIIGALWDREALGVANIDRRVATDFNSKGEFYQNFFKWDAEYFNDFNENFVVFFAA